MKIEFVSDVACPWCAVGLHGLERALERLDDLGPVELRFEPFELNPDLEADGRDIVEYLSRKYGRSPDQIAQTQQAIRERGAAVGFAFGPRERTWNTFDAHRLLAWAGDEGPPGAQRALKHALLRAYHGDGRNPSAPDVLREAAVAAGLDGNAAQAVIDGDRYADVVRARERHWQQLGIQAVPSVIVDGRHLIQGGQPPEVYEQALRQIAAARTTA
jgi:predicted DsbA family dithiol-disulfide isomerase